MSRQQKRAAMARRAERREDFMWQRSIKQQDSRLDALDRDADQAEKEYEKLGERLASIESRARADIDRAVADIVRQATAEERRVLSTPLTRYAGAGHGRPATWVWHTKASMPDGLARRVGILGQDGGPLLVLREHGGVAESDLAPSVLRAEMPEIAHDASFIGWSDQTISLLPEVAARYSILELLRNDDWLSALLESAGITSSSTQAESVTGTYGVVERKVTTVTVPTVSDVRVTRTGLRVTFAHQPGRSAKDWVSKSDALRAGLKNAGLDADNMKVSDGPGGVVVLDMNDVDPFAQPLPSVIHPYDAVNGKSYVGQSADGGDVWVTWKNNACAIVAGMQGGGKTASMLPVLAGLAGHAEIHLLDGNASGEWAPISPLCATYDDTGDITALGDLIEELIPVSRDRLRTITDRTGEINFWDVPASRREALGLFPIVIAVEEAPQYLSKNQMSKDDRLAAERNMTMVGKAVKLFRKAGITVLLIVQKPTDSEIPTIIRDMAGWRLCFRLDSDVAAATVLGDAAYSEPKPTSIPPGKPGRFVGRVDTRGSVLGQAVYVPIADIRAALADSKTVPDQRHTQKVVSRPTVAEAVEEPDTPVTPPAVEQDESTESTGVEGFSL
ncbi:hypothetical protein P5V90_09475 [Mycobacteroides abscessus subsp. abscessus]|uniref:hypothetical protein n=1 Tax=Mycobacteroides abscessus TaxID=36809 RepID=UPI00266C7473|nr:hypothetical protein [Mycobacteroides abscessus]MDO3167183.1 hypothetical protein [Mycobacteroides abscessus subsp. abscessus]